MARTKSIPQVVQTIKRGQGSGKVFTPQQLATQFTKQFREMADAIKEFMLELLEADSRHRIRRDQSGLYHKTKVSVDLDGGKISLPDYAQALDKGRAPRTKLVPLDVLIAWVKRYRILGRTRKSGQFKKASQDSINAAAHAIQRSIYTNGIKARPFLDATLEYQQVLLAAIVEQVMVPQILSVVELVLTPSPKK